MPEVRQNVPCPTPGCSGSRADVYLTDDDGRIIARTGSEPCGTCGN